MTETAKKNVARILVAALILPAMLTFSQPMRAYAAETSTHADSLPAEPVKVPTGKTAAEVIKNPAQPEIYTLRNDYKVTRAGNTEVNYQPYVATVGAAATDAEKAKVSKTITLPKFANYDNPKDAANNTIDDYDITYKGIVDAATGPGATKTGKTEYGFAHQASRDFLYKGVGGTIRVRHVFQDLKDFSKYGPKPGESNYIYTTQSGNLGDLPLIEALPAEQTKGFVPENTGMKVVIAKDSITLDQRYNLAHFDATFDTGDGTPVPAHTLYYGQVIPPLANSDIPTKIGATFMGWKPSVNLKGTVNRTITTFNAGKIMKDSSGKAIKNLDSKLIMPAQNVKFTAVWKEKSQAKYTVLYWAEKADHADSAKLRDKYDFIGTRVINNVATGYSPDLSAETIENVEFPDLDADRLQKAWTNKSYFNKFYVYNDDLTKTENAEAGNPAVVKSVSSTGKTVYNVYYDRQVYTLYFTKYIDDYENFFPTIVKNGKTVGTPEKPYTFKARFNQRMVDQWPNDSLEVKGFSEANNSIGWILNIPYDDLPEDWDSLEAFRDTPPYRLSADLFLDIKRQEADHELTPLPEDLEYIIPIKEQPDQTGGPFDISLGIQQDVNVMPHHLDFWLEDFEGNFIPDYDLYRVKSDTDLDDYKPKTPPILGYTAVSEQIPSEHFEEHQLDDYNNSREAVKPFDNNKAKMRFYKNFTDGDGFDFATNGYMKFMYTRNKYELKFNNNPDILKADSAYTKNEKTDIFYDYKISDLKLDNPQNLFKLGLTHLLDQDQHGNYKVKKPAGIPEHYEFKGWALDPKGTKMVRDGIETMPNHNMVLYAKWDEPDKKWKVIFDPDGGNLQPLDEKKLTKTQSTILEGDAEQQVEVTYPQKLANDGDKQQFTVLQRQQLVEPPTPTRDGYNFLGWEVLRYKKDANGTYTTKFDDSYNKTYGVHELYHFGNDVVDPIYLKAVWVPDNLEEVTVYHHFLDKEYRIDKTEDPNPRSRIIENQRAGQFVRTSADQSAHWRLATHEELLNSTDQEVLNLYTEYNERLGFNNGYFQTLQVEPKKITIDGRLVDNPKYKNNVFHFFYVPFRTRNYKVNYVDNRAETELNAATSDAQKKAIIEKYRILDQETVESKARHYDARNYKPISGWKLTSPPQQQLFYDVDEKTNKLIGINDTGSDEITFFYQDVRILEVPSKGTTPPGYVRVTFKASNGGSFGTDNTGNPIKKLSYDVLEGTKSNQLPVPQELPNGASPVNGKYYITPNAGLSFAGWDNHPLLPAGTVLKKADESSYVFTAHFERHPLVTNGVVTTEAFTDPAGTWTNNFAPTLEALKESIQQKENGVRKKLPADATVKLFDEHNNEITTADAIYDLVKENGKTGTEEPVRTIPLKAKVTFSDDPTPREITVPIKVYKNRYEATASGEMPDALKKATTGPSGDLVNLLKDTATRNYVKVTVNPTNKLTGLSPKTYWVNPKAWVDIPEITVSDELKASSGFKHWSANRNAQNEADGAFYFAKRHKFSENTIIAPVFPGSPSTPGGNPSTPGTPSTPGGNPSLPGGNPLTPGGNPLSPSGTPSAPGSPSVPSSPDQKDKSYLSELPETGANSLLYLYAAVLFTLTGALVLRISRKRTRD